MSNDASGHNPYEPPKAVPPEKWENNWNQNADLSGADCGFIVLCSCPAIIVGLVRAMKGDPRGPKMIGFAVVSMIVWSILRGCITAAQQMPHVY